MHLFTFARQSDKIFFSYAKIGLRLLSVCRTAIFIIERISNIMEHKKIGFIGDRHTEDKLRLFYKATERLGVSTYPEYIAVESTRFEEAGYNGMERMIKSGNMPTALLAAYDDIAIGAIHCMEKHGLKCPEDMSVIGIDNIKTASYEHISLTTISSNTEKMNSIAAAILFKKIENRAFNVFQSVTVKSTLVLRNSVKNISGN